MKSQRNETGQEEVINVNFRRPHALSRFRDSNSLCFVSFIEIHTTNGDFILLMYIISMSGRRKLGLKNTRIGILAMSGAGSLSDIETVLEYVPNVILPLLCIL